MEKQGEKVRQQRLVIVVHPFQGHISPILQLGTILLSKGFSVTIVHPEFNSPNPSTLESICEGVPLLCRPFFGDQILNSRYICYVWKVGLEVEKGKIAEGIRRLMKDEEGMEIRKRAMDLKEKTEACIREGGSTITSLNEFSKQLLLG